MVTVGGPGMKSGLGRDSRRRGKGKGVNGPEGVRACGRPMPPGGTKRRRFASGLVGKANSELRLKRGEASVRALRLLRVEVAVREPKPCGLLFWGLPMLV